MKGWRTLGFNLALVAVGVLQAFDWTSVLGTAPYVGWIVTGIGLVGTVLRTATTGPVGTKV